MTNCFYKQHEWENSTISHDSIEPQLPFRISVCTRTELPQYEGREITHLLSIDRPEDTTEAPEWFLGVHWHVVFQDVEDLDDARKFNAVPPTIKEIHRVLKYTESCLKNSRSEPVHLLVHCLEGGNRSTAVAYAILSMLLGEGHEGDALKHLLRISPDAFPNMLVVQHADTIMGRNGRLLKALRPLRDEVSNAVDELAKMVRESRERT